MPSKEIWITHAPSATTQKLVLEKVLIETESGIIEVRIQRAEENGQPLQLKPPQVRILDQFGKKLDSHTRMLKR